MKQTEQISESAGLTLRAPAKINLFLKVLNRRPDGYHEIASMMQKIALFDVLHLAWQDKNISISCPGGSVPEDERNLAYRAARAFLAATGTAAGVRIVLEKNIPVAAGLGGGSSDAAAVLRGLNRLAGGGLALECLMDIGLRLGADVPFFIQDTSAAMAAGIGECLRQAAPLRDYWIVLVNPGFAVSTKWVYENFPLTSGVNPYILAPVRKLTGEKQDFPPGLFEEIGNDLEAVSISRYPEIGDIKKQLKKTGAVAALMSGSGPTVFGLFPGKEEAQRSYAGFAAEYGASVFLVRPYIP